MRSAVVKYNKNLEVEFLNFYHALATFSHVKHSGALFQVLMAINPIRIGMGGHNVPTDFKTPIKS